MASEGSEYCRDHTSKVCVVHGCPNLQVKRYGKLRLCQKHFKVEQTRGSSSVCVARRCVAAVSKPGEYCQYHTSRICSVDRCPNVITKRCLSAGHLCLKHYEEQIQVQKARSLTSRSKAYCPAKNCTVAVSKRGEYCQKHASGACVTKGCQNLKMINAPVGVLLCCKHYKEQIQSSGGRVCAVILCTTEASEGDYCHSHAARLCVVDECRTLVEIYMSGARCKKHRQK